MSVKLTLSVNLLLQNGCLIILILYHSTVAFLILIGQKVLIGFPLKKTLFILFIRGTYLFFIHIFNGNGNGEKSNNWLCLSLSCDLFCPASALQRKSDVTCFEINRKKKRNFFNIPGITALFLVQ